MDTIREGDFVTIIGQDSIGEVVSVKGNNLELAIGLMKVTVKKDKVKRTNPPVHQQVKENVQENFSIDTKEKMLHFQFELDIRGKLKEDVLLEVTTWIDDAILLGVEEAKIIHGRGSGVLKETVRGLLRKYKGELTFSDGSKENGADSVTMVMFNKI